jgi:hypothetical protein
MRRFLSRHRSDIAGLVALAGLAVVLVRPLPAGPTAKAGPDKAAVERARTTVRLLDDLHKGYVVYITDTYVKAQEKTPAARVAKKVFKHMEEKGWGSGRLVDATGNPINEKNVPKTDFEKRAVAKLKKGQAYFDEVATRKGKPVLRAATPVPVVMNQCITCHPGYKKGDLLGALIYEVPIK